MLTSDYYFFFTGKNEMEEFLESHNLPSLSGFQRDKKKIIFKDEAFQCKTGFKKKSFFE